MGGVRDPHGQLNRRPWAWPLLALGALGCTAEPPVEPAVGPPVVWLGSGEHTFVPLEEDPTLQIHRGPQGGASFHVYAAFRLADPGLTVHAVRVYALDDDAQLTAGNLSLRPLDIMGGDCRTDRPPGEDCTYAGQELMFHFEIPRDAGLDDYPPGESPFEVPRRLSVELGTGERFEEEFFLSPEISG